MTDKTFVLNLSVMSTDPNVILRTTEVFARAAVGLLLDGVGTNFMFSEIEEEPADDDIAVGGSDD